MPDLWELPGYDVLELLGFGGTGEVWRARELATGDTVALKRLRPGVDPAVLRREATVLRQLDTPYVVRLRAVLGEGEGLVLVLDHAAGGSLASLLLARGRLSAGEAVTVAQPLAQALAAAHARGLVHGDLTPSNVLLTADGMPLLSDLGLARAGGADAAGAVDGTAEYVDPAVAAGAAPTAASDVWALAAVVHHMLAGCPPHDGRTAADVLGAAAAGERAPLGLLAPLVPQPLVVVVESALAADPADRPDAARFAAALRRAHSPQMLVLPGPPAAGLDPVRPTHRVREGAAPAGHAAPRRRPHLPPRFALVGAVALAALVAAALVGWRTGGDDPVPVALTPAGPPTSQAQERPAGGSSAGGSELPAGAAPAAPDWAAVLDGLDAARSAAYAAGDPAALGAAYAPRSPALRADSAVLAGLTAQGRTARGLRHAVRTVRQVAFDGRTARLQVRDVLAPYEVLDAGGAVLARRPGRAERPYDVVLVRTAGGFRLQQVRGA